MCGSRTVWVDDVRSPPGKIVSGRISFCFRRPRGHQGSWARRKASPFKTTVCILLWNYVFCCGIMCMLLAKKSANKCRWQRRRDRPRPSHPLRVRRWQAAIALLSALARSHDPPHSSSNCMFAPRFQPHGTPLICCTDLLPHTPTPTNTPLGDGTSLNWMPLRAASAHWPARDATQCSAVRRPHKNALKVHPMFTQNNQCN